jgi:hypothetical protein
MKNILLAVSMTIFACVPSIVQAGWWHHPHHQGYMVHQAPAYSAAPAYYAASAPAQQSSQYSPQQALVDALITKVIGKAIESIDRLEIDGKRETEGGKETVRVESNVDLSEVLNDLDDLKSGLKNLDERVENVNSTLRRHGEFMIALQADVNKLKEEFGETKPLTKTLKNVEAKLKGITLDEINKALNSSDLEDELKNIIKDEPTRTKALAAIKKEYEKVLSK